MATTVHLPARARAIGAMALRVAPLILGLCAPALAQDEAQPSTAEEPVRVILRFSEGRNYSGIAKRVPETGELALDAEAFSTPAVIDWAALERFTVVDDQARAVQIRPGGRGGDVLTAIGGQRLYGQLRSISDDAIEFESARFGRLVVPIEVAGELTHVPAEPDGRAAGQGAPGGEAEGEQELDAGTEPGEPGPAALDAPWSDWWPRGDGDDVDVEAGSLRLLQESATVSRAIGAGVQRIAFDMTWRGVPEFSISLDGDPDADPGGGIVIEPWDGHLTMYRRRAGELEIVQWDRPLDMDSQGTLRLSVEEQRVRLLTHQTASGASFDINLEIPRTPRAEDAPASRLWFRALGRPMTLHEVLVEGAEALRDAQGRVVFQRRLRSSEVKGFDPATRELLTDQGPTLLDTSRGVAFLHRSKANELRKLEAELGFGLVILRDGEVVEVDSVDFQKGSFVVEPRWSSDAVSIPLKDVLRVRFNATRTASTRDAFEYRLGSGKAQTAGFQGVHYENGEAFLRRKEPGFKTIVSAKVEGSLYLKRATRSLFHVSRRKYPHEVVLRDQQSFPARLVGVTGDSMEVRTPFARESVVLARGDVKALLIEPLRAQSLFSELGVQEAEPENNRGVIFGGGAQVTRRDPALVTKDKLERALQVLRTQTGDPGTHLLVARNGDLLRTNAVALEGETLKVDGGSGGAMSIPMDLLAAWVHVDPDDQATPTEEGENLWTVVFNARATLRMNLIGTKDGSMTFRHPKLGAITVGSDEFDLIEYKRPFEPESRVFMEWVTRPIAEPVLDPNRQAAEAQDDEGGR